jgi:hypothetical protein
MMDMVRELGQGDVFQGLTDLLTKKDRAVKLKALGALAQLPYFSRRNKAIMCGNERCDQPQPSSWHGSNEPSFFILMQQPSFSPMPRHGKLKLCNEAND